MAKFFWWVHNAVHSWNIPLEKQFRQVVVNSVTCASPNVYLNLFRFFHEDLSLRENPIVFACCEFFLSVVVHRGLIMLCYPPKKFFFTSETHINPRAWTAHARKPFACTTLFINYVWKDLVSFCFCRFWTSRQLFYHSTLKATRWSLSNLFARSPVS